MKCRIFDVIEEVLLKFQASPNDILLPTFRTIVLSLCSGSRFSFTTWPEGWKYCELSKHQDLFTNHIAYLLKNYEISVFIEYKAKVTFTKHSELETGNKDPNINVNHRGAWDVIGSSTNTINSWRTKINLNYI